MIIINCVIILPCYRDFFPPVNICIPLCWYWQYPPCDSYPLHMPLLFNQFTLSFLNKHLPFLCLSSGYLDWWQYGWMEPPQNHGSYDAVTQSGRHSLLGGWCWRVFPQSWQWTSDSLVSGTFGSLILMM